MILDMGKLDPSTITLLHHAVGLMLRLNDERVTPTAREELEWLKNVLEYEQSRPPEPTAETVETVEEKVAGPVSTGSGF